MGHTSISSFFLSSLLSLLLSLQLPLAAYCTIVNASGHGSAANNELHGEILVRKSIFVANKNEQRNQSDQSSGMENLITWLKRSEDVIYDDNHSERPPPVEMQLSFDNRISFLDQFTNTNLTDFAPLTLTPSPSPSANDTRLNQSFLSFFDELWRIKNSSAATLIRLDYFNNQKANNSFVAIDDGSNNLQFVGQQPEAPSGAEQELVESKPTGKQKLAAYLNRVLLLKVASLNNGLAFVASQFNERLFRLHRELRALVERLVKTKWAHGLFGGGGGPAWSQFMPQQQQQQQIGLGSSQTNNLDDQNEGSTEEAENGDSVQQYRAQVRSEREAIKSARPRKKRQVPGTATSFLNDDQSLAAPVPSGGGGEGEGGSIEPGGMVLMTTMGSSTRAGCIELNADQKSRCRATERFVHLNLNSTFPGTMAAILENCNQITFLLAKCWPDQLLQLRASAGSRNISQLATTEFQLPLGFKELYPRQSSSFANENSRQEITLVSSGNNRASSYDPQPGCGLESNWTPQIVRDRVNWMWLNLCADRKFRQDYVENLRCLSMWSQERAQQVCPNENKRMHAYLMSHAEGNSRSRAVERPPGVGKAAGDHRQSPTHAGNSNKANSLNSHRLDSNIAGHNNNQDMVSGELGSKRTCCVFDQFLRCVSKQAARDCGPQGAQFVVDFITRIGTDDMKYLCNNEVRIGPNGGATIRYKPTRKNYNYNLADKSPFLENNYCLDPRIQSVLYAGAGVGNGGGPDKGGGINNERYTPLQTGGNSNIGLGNGGGINRPFNPTRKNPANINPDPTYFGSDTITASGVGSQRIHYLATVGHSSILLSSVLWSALGLAIL